METKTAPTLCEIATDGRTAAQLVASIEAQGKKVWPYTKGICLGDGKDPFPVVPTGETWKLGVLFASELGSYPTNTKVWADMSARGLGKPHPTAALYLRERYSQAELLAAVNALRPAGVPEAALVVVQHEPLRDSNGNANLFGLDQDVGVGDVYAYYGDAEFEWNGNMAFVVLQQEDSGSQPSGPHVSALSPSVSVPRAWVERLVEIASQVLKKPYDAEPSNAAHQENWLRHLLGYIESARGLLTDVTKTE